MSKKHHPHRRKRRRNDWDLIRTTSKSSPFEDGYYWILKASWIKLIAAMGVSFLGINALFGFLYLFTGGLSGDNSFSEAFFFSVHTIATVGYGNIYPVTPLANSLVTLEIMLGILMISMTTGLLFAKFSKSRAMVVFSHVGVVNQRNGVPCFSFRVANERSTHVAEAQMSLALLKTQVTQEGETYRKLYDMNLERSNSPVFILSWTLFHPIDQDSPLFGVTPEEFEKDEMFIVASFTGYDPVLGQTIHDRYAYEAKDLMWNAKLKDAMTRPSKQVLHLDYELFHAYEELDSDIQAPTQK